MRKLKYKNYRLLLLVPSMLICLAVFIVGQVMNTGAEKNIVYGVLIGGGLVLAIQIFVFVGFIKPKLQSEEGE
jgi:hypothetical protein